jgi:hypothetical protein
MEGLRLERRGYVLQLLVIIDDFDTLAGDSTLCLARESPRLARRSGPEFGASL